MGLDTTHDCWHGAYSAFHRWRMEIARVVGIPLGLMEGYWQGLPLVEAAVSVHPGEFTRKAWAEHCRYLPLSWDLFDGDPLVVLLSHSDCDGNIAAADCAPLADRLEDVLRDMPTGDGGGHIGDWREKTQAFINGLRRAAAAGEDVEFH